MRSCSWPYRERAVRLRLYLDTSVLGVLMDPGPEERCAKAFRYEEG